MPPQTTRHARPRFRVKAGAIDLGIFHGDSPEDVMCWLAFWYGYAPATLTALEV